MAMLCKEDLPGWFWVAVIPIIAIHTGVLILRGVNSLLSFPVPEGREQAVELVLPHKLRCDHCS